MARQWYLNALVCWRIGQFPKREFGVVHVQVAAGEVLGGRYTVKRELGRGGVGVVYLCDDAERREAVALKLLLPQFMQNTQAVARFKREVQAVRQFDHPGIVRVYDTGRLGDALFYTMEFLDGDSLRQILERKKRLKLSQAVYIARSIVEVLAFAHPNVIHRDLSPENVLVRPTGTITLLDFGQAKIPNRSALTIAGVALGKDVYGAPEQMADASSADARSDLYSLGVILTEMITGTAPLKFAPVRARHPEAPPEVDGFLERCLKQDPSERFQSADEALEALRDVYTAVASY